MKPEEMHAEIMKKVRQQYPELTKRELEIVERAIAATTKVLQDNLAKETMARVRGVLGNFM